MNRAKARAKAVPQHSLGHRLLSSTVLFFFAWSNVHPAFMAAAQAAPKDRDAMAHVSVYHGVSQALDETLATADRLQRKTARQQSVADEKQALKELRQWLQELDHDVRNDFQSIEIFLRQQGIGGSVLQRHNDAVEQYRREMDVTLDNLSSIEAASSSSELNTRVAQLKSHLQNKNPARRHQAFDRASAPFQVPPATVRPPRKSAQQFSALKQQSAMVASVGSMAGLLAMSAVVSGPEHLTSTEDVQLTPAIRDLASQLNNNPVQIYNWVRNNIAYVPSYGSIQGSELTLQARRGNSFDTASLLIALLRAANLPARYVFGTVEIPAAKAMNWLGVALPEAAEQLFAQGGVPVEAVRNGAQVSGFLIEHVWVEALVDFGPSRGAKNRVGDAWVPMDASFKQFSNTAALPLLRDVPSDAQYLVTQLQNSAQIDENEGRITGFDVQALQSGLTEFGQQVDSYIASRVANATVGDVLGARLIAPIQAPVLAAGLPYKPLVEGARYAALPDALRHRFRLSVYASDTDRSSNLPAFTLDRSLPALAGKRLTLAFTPSTADDQAALDSYFPQRHADGSPVQPNEFPSEIPGYVIGLTGEVRVDGAPATSGGSFVMGAGLVLTSGTYNPAQGIWSDTDDTLIAGEYQAFAVDGQGIAPRQLADLGARLAATQLQLTSGQYDAVSRDQISGDLLHQAALSYFAANDGFAALFQRLSNIASYRLPSHGRAVAELLPTYNYGVPVRVSFPGVAIRVDRLQSSAASTGADVTQLATAAAKFQRQGLERGSAYAHLVLENVFKTGQSTVGASAIRALATSLALSQPVYALSHSNVDSVLPLLEMPEEDRADIRNGVYAGLRAVASQSPLTLGGWDGSGYLLTDDVTGAGDYRLTGGATAVLQTATGMPWLAMAQPFQSAAAVNPAFTAAQALDVVQEILLGTPGTLAWNDFASRNELIAGLLAGELGSVPAADPLFRTLGVQTAQLGTSPADALSRINRAPVYFSSPVASGQAGTAYRYTVSAADPEGDPISFFVLRAPSGVTISGSGLVSWDQPVAGSWPVTLRISDGKLYTDQSYTLRIATEAQPLEVSVAVNPPVVDAGAALTITVTTAGGTGTVTRRVIFNNQTLTVPSSGQLQLTAPGTPGVYQVTGSATDANITVSVQRQLGVRDPNDATPPTATITTPAQDASITGPIDIIGTAKDNTVLAYYLLRIRPAGGSDAEWREIRRGTTAVTAGTLGILDPSMLANGLYELSLVAVDVNGATAGALVPVEIIGDLKIGQFRISFEDLNIEAGGIPVRVTRTYDTQRKNENLAFGYGWSVDFQDVRLRKNMTLGLSWDVVRQGSFELCVRPAGKRKVSIALPDGKLHRFEAYNQQDCAFGSVPPVNILFRPIGATTSKLEIVNHPFVEARGGQLFDWDNLETFNPVEFKLTTEENYSFYLREGVGIERIVDPFSNILTYTNSGLIHSNGRSIAFTKDGQGRITAITDPSGKQVKYAYDANGDLISVTDRDSKISRLTYNRSHGLLDYTDPRGVSVVKYLYDDQGRLIATADAEGNRIDVAHDTDNSREVVKNRRGFSTTYVYDLSGNVTEVIDALGKKTTYGYDANGNETSVTDPLGNTTTRSYNATGKVLTESNALGHTTTNTYLTPPSPDVGKVSSVKDARGNVTSYEYPFSFLQTITEPLGRGTSIRSDATTGNLTSLSVGGLGSGYGYDAKSNRTSETDGLGRVTNYSFDLSGHETGSSRTRTTDQGIAVTVTTSRTVDAEGRVTSETNGLGHKTTTVYNAAGKPDTVTDERGKVTRYEYDTNARLTKTTYPDGTFEAIGYDAEGNEISRTDRGGRIARFEYDALNRLSKTLYADGTFAENRYDDAGRLTETVDARGKVTTSEYDKAGRLTKVTDPVGTSTTYGYDQNGNRTSVTDAKLQTAMFEYDALNRLVKTTYPNGTFATTTWLTSGLKDTETDASGRTKKYGYDATGRLMQVIQTLAGVQQTTTYAFDELGNKTTQTDARSKQTKLAYDHGNRLTRRTLPGGQSESFGYDAAGNLTTRTDSLNRATSFKYDDVGREIEKTLSDGTRVTTTYTQSGQVETRADARGVIRYTYDSRDRLTRKTSPEGELRYTYDEAGNKTTETVITGTVTRTVSYGYDDLNRLAGVTADGQQTTYAYDANGNRERISHPNNLSTRYEYDTNNRLTRLTHSRTSDGAILADYRYTLANNGQRTAVEESDGQGVVRTVVYTYDDLSRLTKEQITHRDSSKSRTTSYTYDKVGNRLTRVVGATTTTYAYDDNDRLLTETTGSTVATYSYDANGNTTRKETKTSGLTTAVATYAYDVENRLTEARQGTSDATLMLAGRYAYDADGHRIKTTQADGTQIVHLVDTNRPYAEVLEEVSTSMTGTTRTSYVHGDDLISQVRGGQRSFYHQDGLGSTRTLTNDAGTVTDSYSYEAFGTLTESTGSTTNPYLFTGEPRDPATGFYYLRARWMDPSTGRFTTRDTFQGIATDPPSLHKYLYANADPVNRLDPTGQFTITTITFSPPIVATATVFTVVRPLVLRIALYVIASAVGTYHLVDQKLRTQLEECIESSKRGENKCKPSFPMFVVGDNHPDIQSHISDAIGDGRPGMLSRRNPAHSRDWIRAFRGPGKPCSGAAGTTECDEYPFAASMEGGSQNNVSLRSVSAGQNSSNGAYLGLFYRACRIPANDSSQKYKVLAVRGLPVTGYVCGR